MAATSANLRCCNSHRILPNAPFLFTIGTIVDKKNFHVLPCLLAGNNKKLIIAGITQSEDYKHKIIDEAKRWNVLDRLFFTGTVNENDKQWYIKHCEAFVFPSLAEGFGLPVVEAMYFGKPVIISNLSSLPEVGGRCSLLFQQLRSAEMQSVRKKASKIINIPGQPKELFNRQNHLAG